VTQESLPPVHLTLHASAQGKQVVRLKIEKAMINRLCHDEKKPRMQGKNLEQLQTK
jgi:hypothetical protein